ncbi:hypothetical protein BO94DRAFT_535173 [Aspergillus sclerotioniger CBS 115572]|uniref:ATPase synthesis protein 25 n=1 Tax=Aspergillus sclerotioniger CBS 115572 TaxID=1450535 RepID=A0A317WKN3_9EURO|nr:hypothetical protein BO94DRAFT_535173 [Aspergillus sclerotioniger CBS 115572]PWY87056.1 hypothetical protein BO94DRAFT_535173 [Aspergillus sclerotioniger CBS 115572]
MNRALSRGLWCHRGVLCAPTYCHVIRPFTSLSCLRTEQPSSEVSTVSLKQPASDSSPHGPWYLQGETAVPKSQQTSPTNALFEHLSQLSDEKVRSELGEGPEDRDSTLFLRLFHNQLSISSAEEKAIAQVNLFCSAVSRQHPGYTKQGLYTAFLECSCLGYSVSDDLGFSVVSALLTPRSGGQVPDSDKDIALRVLEHLSLRGTDVVNMKVFNMIYQAAAISPSPTGALSRVSRLIDTLDLPFDPLQARSLMVSHFQHGDYNGFWKLWRKLPLNGSPRTVADYEMLFRLHADLGDKLRARDCLSTWVPMMSREQPPIPLRGELLVDIKHCLVLADPHIAQKAAEGSTSILVRFWNECQSKTHWSKPAKRPCK